jgi:phosphopantothenoylcysteine decarboxylase/phosphopantothenate--cysteine ligase
MAHVLVTSGPTREYLDPVRFLSNASSGRMGAALAAAFLSRGHQVTIVSGPVAVAYPAAARVLPVESTQEMWEACVSVVGQCDGVVAVAAPCDFRPRVYSPQKLKKSPDREGLVLDLVKTPDILGQLTAANPAAWFVGFALESEAGLDNAIEKRRLKGCDLMILNQPQTIGGPNAHVRLIDPTDRCVATYQGIKPEVAAQIVAWIEQNLVNRCSPTGPS